MLRKCLSHAFIIIISEQSALNLCVYSIKHSKIIKKYERSYVDVSEAKKFLEQIISSHYFVYVAQLFKSIAQGLVPSKSPEVLLKFGVEAKNLNIHPLDNMYLYASKSQVQIARSSCELLECDLLYSPFSILQVLKNQRFKKGCNLFMLKYKSLIAILIAKESKILFGNYFELKTSSDEPEVENELYELNSDEPEKFDDLTFEDLDNLDLKASVDEFNDAAFSDELNLANFDIEMLIFDYLKMAIKEFYENPLYQSEFIDQIYIYEQEDSSQTFLNMIKNELYIEVAARRIDVFYEMLLLACKDLGVALEL